MDFLLGRTDASSIGGQRVGCRGTGEEPWLQFGACEPLHGVLPGCAEVHAFLARTHLL